MPRGSPELPRGSSDSMEEKTTLTEFDSIAQLQPTNAASIHDVVTNVSPMKKSQSTSYFEAKLCDDDTQVRLVGFSATQQKRLANCQDTMDPVNLSDVKIKCAKHSDDLELLLKTSSQVQRSPKKIAPAKVAKLVSSNISLIDLQHKKDYDRVNVRAKVLRIEDPVKVSPVLQKQDVTIADSSAAAKITLWEKSIGNLSVHKSYEFPQFAVRTINVKSTYPSHVKGQALLKF